MASRILINYKKSFSSYFIFFDFANIIPIPILTQVHRKANNRYVNRSPVHVWMRDTGVTNDYYNWPQMLNNQEQDMLRRFEVSPEDDFQGYGVVLIILLLCIFAKWCLTD